jgi:oligoribonuclease NrnB/cAMP/cGMP phosphodiesterase (DHH superfamily)
MRVFQHTDNDGVTSGYIVKRKYPGILSTPVTYSEPFPYHLIEKDEFIVVVDYSFKSDKELEPILSKTTNLIWIDHHKTSLAVTKNIKGVRVDTYPAACFLCWKFFFPDEPMPEVVDLVSDYDTWAFKFGNSTKLFNLGLNLYHEPEECDNEDIWENLLNDEENGLIDRLIQEGKIVKRHMDNYYRSILKYSSFETTFQGHTAIVSNAYRMNAELFSKSGDKYDLMIVWFFNGTNFSVSMYSKKVDCEKIARKFGGGGHRSAAGFQVESFPFTDPKIFQAGKKKI